MRLVIDASILVAEVLRVRGREIIAHPELELFSPEETWSETTHELEKRVGLLVRYEHLQERMAHALLDTALEVIEARVALVLREVYDDQMGEAWRRVPQDPKDAPLAALAMTLDYGIWTGDRDFFGCGLPVWSTEVLLRHLWR